MTDEDGPENADAERDAARAASDERYLHDFIALLDREDEVQNRVERAVGDDIEGLFSEIGDFEAKANLAFQGYQAMLLDTSAWHAMAYGHREVSRTKEENEIELAIQGLDPSQAAMSPLDKADLVSGLAQLGVLFGRVGWKGYRAWNSGELVLPWVNRAGTAVVDTAEVVTSTSRAADGAAPAMVGSVGAGDEVTAALRGLDADEATETAIRQVGEQLGMDGQQLAGFIEANKGRLFPLLQQNAESIQELDAAEEVLEHLFRFAYLSDGHHILASGGEVVLTTIARNAIASRRGGAAVVDIDQLAELFRWADANPGLLDQLKKAVVVGVDWMNELEHGAQFTGRQLDVLSDLLGSPAVRDLATNPGAFGVDEVRAVVVTGAHRAGDAVEGFTMNVGRTGQGTSGLSSPFVDPSDLPVPGVTGPPTTLVVPQPPSVRLPPPTPSLPTPPPSGRPPSGGTPFDSSKGTVIDRPGGWIPGTATPDGLPTPPTPSPGTAPIPGTQVPDRLGTGATTTPIPDTARVQAAHRLVIGAQVPGLAPAGDELVEHLKILADAVAVAQGNPAGRSILPSNSLAAVREALAQNPTMLADAVVTHGAAGTGALNSSHFGRLDWLFDQPLFTNPGSGPALFQAPPGAPGGGAGFDPIDELGDILLGSDTFRLASQPASNIPSLGRSTTGALVGASFVGLAASTSAEEGVAPGELRRRLQRSDVVAAAGDTAVDGALLALRDDPSLHLVIATWTTDGVQLHRPDSIDAVIHSQPDAILLHRPGVADVQLFEAAHALLADGITPGSGLTVVEHSGPTTWLQIDGPIDALPPADTRWHTIAEEEQRRIDGLVAAAEAMLRGENVTVDQADLTHLTERVANLVAYAEWLRSAALPSIGGPQELYTDRDIFLLDHLLASNGDSGVFREILGPIPSLSFSPTHTELEELTPAQVALGQLSAYHHSLYPFTTHGLGDWVDQFGNARRDRPWSIGPFTVGRSTLSRDLHWATDMIIAPTRYATDRTHTWEAIQANEQFWFANADALRIYLNSLGSLSADAIGVSMRAEALVRYLPTELTQLDHLLEAFQLHVDDLPDRADEAPARGRIAHIRQKIAHLEGILDFAHQLADDTEPMIPALRELVPNEIDTTLGPVEFGAAYGNLVHPAKIGLVHSSLARFHDAAADLVDAPFRTDSVPDAPTMLLTYDAAAERATPPPATPQQPDVGLDVDEAEDDGWGCLPALIGGSIVALVVAALLIWTLTGGDDPEEADQGEVDGVLDLGPEFFAPDALLPFGVDADEWPTGWFVDPETGISFSITEELALYLEAIDVNQSQAVRGEYSPPVAAGSLGESSHGCGVITDTYRVTCQVGAGPVEAGEYIVVVVEHNATVGVGAETFTYGLAFDDDGDSSDNYQFTAPFTADFFRDTEHWYRLQIEADGTRRMWADGFRDGTPGYPRYSAAIVVEIDNTLVWVIPRAELPGDDLAYRVTAFHNNGPRGAVPDPASSGGDVSGEGVEEPLLPVPDPVVRFDQVDALPPDVETPIPRVELIQDPDAHIAEALLRQTEERFNSALQAGDSEAVIAMVLPELLAGPNGAQCRAEMEATLVLAEAIELTTLPTGPDVSAGFPTYPAVATIQYSTGTVEWGPIFVPGNDGLLYLLLPTCIPS